MALRGIDISGYDPGIDVSAIGCDFAIIKATEGTGYVNPCLDDQLSSAGGARVGFYHYASGGDAIAEADHFLATLGDRRGLLCLDWESIGNAAFGSGSDEDWCHTWAQHVTDATGEDVILYVSRSVVDDFPGWSHRRMWVAQYADDDDTGWQDTPWNDDIDCGYLIRQYTSCGRVGYDGRLDLDKFEGDADEWDAIVAGNHSNDNGGDSNVGVSRQAAIDRAEEICADDRYGYSLGGWGSEGEGYGIDCRGLVSAALVAGGYPTGGFTCTYDMRDCLTSAGWTWHDGTDGLTDCQMCVALHPKSSSGASDGHTALWVGDHFCEAWHDYSGGGSDGDPSGREVRTRDYYDFPWSGYLTWDGEDDDMSELTESHRADAFGDGDSGADPRTRIEYIDHYTGDLSRELLRTDDGGTGDGSTGDLYARICWMDRRIRELKEVTIPAMETAIKALADSKGADPDAVAKAVSDAVAAKLASVEVSVTTK